MSEIGSTTSDAGQKLRHPGRQRQPRNVGERHSIDRHAARRAHDDGRRCPEHLERPVQRRDVAGGDLIDDGCRWPTVQVRVGAERAAEQRRAGNRAVVEHQAAGIYVERLILANAYSVRVCRRNIDRRHARAGLRNGRLECDRRSRVDDRCGVGRFVSEQYCRTEIHHDRHDPCSRLDPERMASAALRRTVEDNRSFARFPLKTTAFQFAHQSTHGRSHSIFSLNDCTAEFRRWSTIVIDESSRITITHNRGSCAANAKIVK